MVCLNKLDCGPKNSYPPRLVTLLEPQSRFGDNVAQTTWNLTGVPQNGTGVLKGLIVRSITCVLRTSSTSVMFILCMLVHCCMKLVRKSVECDNSVRFRSMVPSGHVWDDGGWGEPGTRPTRK